MTNKQLNKIRALLLKHESGSLDQDKMIEYMKIVLFQDEINKNMDRARAALSYVG